MNRRPRGETITEVIGRCCADWGRLPGAGTSAVGQEQLLGISERMSGLSPRAEIALKTAGGKRDWHTGAALAQAPPVPAAYGDAHRRVQGKPAAVVTLFHVPEIVLVQYPAVHEGPQDTAAHLALHRLGILRIHLVDSVEACPARRIGLEYAVGDADMEVRMQVEQGTEAMDEGYRTGAGILPRRRAVRAQVALDLVDEDARGAVERLAVMRKVIAQPLACQDFSRPGLLPSDCLLA
jgi:hypothetical protein